jgi:protein-S-isoprenylcysteine O-methyltransferase Ste14
VSARTRQARAQKRNKKEGGRPGSQEPDAQKPGSPALQAPDAQGGSRFPSQDPGVEVGSRPRSASSFALSFLALLLGLLAVFFSRRIWPGNTLATLLCGAGTVGGMLVLGDLLLLKVTWRASTGLAQEPLRSFELQQAALRVLGLLATLGAIALIYWLFPEYHGRFYQPFWNYLQVIGWPVLCLSPFYFLWIGRRLEQPEDAYLQIGRLLTGRGWDRIEPPLLRSHFAGWAVKAFFLPLMVVYLTDEIGTVSTAMKVLSWDTMRWYKFFFELSFLIDLLFCVVGYTLTLRVLDSHIRSTEPTAFGWLVALACYQPFYSVIGTYYLKYDESSIFWDVWLSGYPAIRVAWALAILLLTVTYSLCTVSFGTRFSNLTHRGIITSGPYRFTKHPAYLSKNLSWWLVSVPLLSRSGWLDGLRHCVLLGGLNFVYFLRAWTEERHLSNDPVYVAYAQWIREHGMFSWLRRLWLRRERRQVIRSP